MTRRTPGTQHLWVSAKAVALPRTGTASTPLIHRPSSQNGLIHQLLTRMIHCRIFLRAHFSASTIEKTRLNQNCALHHYSKCQKLRFSTNQRSETNNFGYYCFMARPDPNGLIEFDGTIYVAFPTSGSKQVNGSRPKAHLHQHRYERVAAIQLRMEIDGRRCWVCGNPIPMTRQANALFCEPRGSCARRMDNIRRRTKNRICRSTEEIRQLYERLQQGVLRGAARRNAVLTVLLWIEANGPNVRETAGTQTQYAM